MFSTIFDFSISFYINISDSPYILLTDIVMSIVFARLCYFILLASSISSNISDVFNLSFFRCRIPQCDTDNPPYNPDWLQQAVPFDSDSGKPKKCTKYHFVSNSSSFNNTCGPKSFDINSHEKCDKWVFADTERTIVSDVSRITN